MFARDLEDHMLQVCVDVAQGRVHHLTVPEEANAVATLCVFLDDKTHFDAKQKMRHVSAEYLFKHPEHRKGLKDVSQEKWCLGLPRFKEMFLKYLQFDMLKTKGPVSPNQTQD